MDSNQDTFWALVKGAIAWLGALLGSLTLSKGVLFMTFIFTALQTYVLVRDKILRRKGRYDSR